MRLQNAGVDPRGEWTTRQEGRGLRRAELDAPTFTKHPVLSNVVAHRRDRVMRKAARRPHKRPGREIPPLGGL